MKKKQGPIRVSDLADTATKSPKKTKKKKHVSSDQSAYGFVRKPSPLLSAETLGNLCRKMGHELLNWEKRLKQTLKKRE
ncbi:MAG: hypothetical protein EB120_13010, partial [Proteobacteria bacterium]|nr:hypothetical protein [Pseudomonadota bacterium]